MISIVERTVLIGSGLLLGMIGGALIIIPVDFLKMSEVFIELDPALMSELSAPSGVLIMTAILLMLGAFDFRLTNLALVAGAIVYGGYSFGRLVSMALHGTPSDALVSATMIELGVAALLVGTRVWEVKVGRCALKSAEWNEVIV